MKQNNTYLKRIEYRSESPKNDEDNNTNVIIAIVALIVCFVIVQQFFQMIFDTSNIIERQKSINYHNKLLEKKGVIEIIDKKLRTLNQNSYLHVIIAHLAMDKGYDCEYTKLHFYKKEANKDLFPIVGEKINFVTGEIDPVYKSSSKLTKEEMTLSIERFRNWSATVANCYLPSSDEREFLQHIQIEMKKQEEFL